MTSQKTLKLYVYVDGVNDVPFYGVPYEDFVLANGELFTTKDGFVFNVVHTNENIEIGAFRYDAKRMGGAPTITASVYYPYCLDDLWADNVYAEFNGEKYYLKQTPTSSYNNESTMYKHDLELVSERVILDNVYFFDAVVGDPQGEDKPVSNSTKVVFFGNIHEFVKRLNSSLEYAKLLKWEDGVDKDGNAIKIPNGYYVVVDNDNNITKEEKLMSFEDQFFSNVLQEIYNTYEVPYYFEGKTIHIGYSNSDVAVPTFSYGVDDALLSITKNNANYKIVNRATATGSSDNIPFYYPNNSPKGEIAATPSGNFEVKILDTELYSNEIKLDGVIRKSNVEYENAKVTFGGTEIYSGETFSAQMGYGGTNKEFRIEFTSKDAGIFLFSFSSSVTKYILKEEEKSDATFGIRYFVKVYDRTANKYIYNNSTGSISSIEDFEVQVPYANHKYEIIIECFYAPEGKYSGKGGQIVFNASYSFGSKSGWMYEDKVVDLKDVGLEVVGNAAVGDTITQTLVKYVKTSQNLMPSIYRETEGAERFYNATNGTYEGVEFNNPYVEGRPKEHIFTVEDIKPTIKETEVNGLRIDMFSEFAYDDDDNDDTIENENGDRDFVHSFFFAKLRKLDFNLFDHAIENQPMTISFTSGDCGACNFEIGVTKEFPQKNPVQVNADGTLKRDEKGRVICGQFEDITEDECQPQQQDTINNEVWIALKKEEDTYGILMPKAPKFNEAGEQIEAGHRPKACTEGQNDGDTFVILGINLPQSYIINAEKKLEAEIIKYLQDNNDEKFTFSIEFSRIYFEENNILDQLSENSKIAIMYNGQRYDLYVSSFSYSMGEGDVLPEIRVELDDTLKVSQNALQNAISQVKSELGRAIGSIDVVGIATPYFIRKDADDEAQGRINFKKGVKFGEGGKVEILDNNSAKLTIEYLEVTKKASFTSLEIQEKTHAGGQILVTPAAINCGEVEEFDNYYRCYFQTKGTDGDEIFNQFAVGDQAICQTYNAWESRYYWRKVVGIGEDYIDLSKIEGEYDEDSDAPMAGDKIIQLGNQTDTTRQNAIVIAAYGDGSPYIIQYKGINSFEITDDKIVTKLSSTENIFTGRVHMELGSTISEDIIGNLNETISNAIGGLELGKYNLLRNSGFTGDFVTESLDNGSLLDEDSKMFSDPLRHWNATNAVVQDSEVGQSGKEIVLTNGTLSQTLHDKIIYGENYVLSFRGKGSSFDYSIGGVSGTVALDDQWTKVVHKFTATSDVSTFAISNANATICDLQLERGTVQSSWGYSMWDNQSELAKYQSMQYLEAAMRNGSTDVLGGLILTNLILLGNHGASDNNAGISGIRNDDNDVAFWGGGTYAQAIDTVMKYAEDPTYKPTMEELASMAKAVITHGGRAILNDVIVRGTVYAKDGEFTGTVYAKDGEFTGKVNATTGSFSGKITAKEGTIGPFDINNWTLKSTSNGSESVDNKNYDRKDIIELSSSSLGVKSDIKDESGVRVGYSQCVLYPAAKALFAKYAAIIENSVVPHAQANPSFPYEETPCIALSLRAEGANEINKQGFGGNFALQIEDGMVAGLRPRMRIITESGNYNLSDLDHTIVTQANDIAIELILPLEPKMGQTYKIWKQGSHTLNIDPNGSKILNMGINANSNKRSFGASFYGTIELIYHTNKVWLMVYVNNKALNG